MEGLPTWHECTFCKIIICNVYYLLNIKYKRFYIKEKSVTCIWTTIAIRFMKKDFFGWWWLAAFTANRWYLESYEQLIWDAPKSEPGENPHTGSLTVSSSVKPDIAYK